MERRAADFGVLARKEREEAERARKAEEEAKAKYLEAERVALEELEKQRQQRWKMQQEPVSWDELSSRQQHVCRTPLLQRSGGGGSQRILGGQQRILGGGGVR